MASMRLVTRPFLQTSQKIGSFSAAITYPLPSALLSQSAGRFLRGCVSYFTLEEISGRARERSVATAQSARCPISGVGGLPPRAEKIYLALHLQLIYLSIYLTRWKEADHVRHETFLWILLGRKVGRRARLAWTSPPRLGRRTSRLGWRD